MVKKIENSFRLYQGTRESIEDDRILKKVLSLVENEILEFADENLNLTQKSYLNKLMTEKGKERKVIKSLVLFMENVPDFQIRFRARINYFIDSLAVKALTNRK